MLFFWDDGAIVFTQVIIHKLCGVFQFSVSATVSDLKNKPHGCGSEFMFAAVKLADEQVSNQSATSSARYGWDVSPQGVC